MKNIDITSDVHTTFIYKNFKDIYWSNWVLTQKWKYLIIAWDINEDILDLQKSLDDIIDNTTYEKIIVTFGNHDLWYNTNDLEFFNLKNSIEKYEFLKSYLHNYKWKIHILDVKNFIIPETKQVIVGNMWWYNYSIPMQDKYYLEKYYKADFDKMSFSWVSYNDRIYIKFSDKITSNIEFATYLEKDLISKLEEAKQKYPEYEIIWVSHIKPSNKLETDSKYYLSYTPETWEEIIKDWVKWISSYNLEKIYGWAFYVNDNISKLYNKYWVKVWIYWHTHFCWEKEVNWVKYISNAFWYYMN